MESDTFSTPESAEHFKIVFEQEMEKKGYKVDSKHPDFEVLVQRLETYVEKYKSVYGNVEFPKAMLRVDFLEPSSGNNLFETAADAYFDPDAKQAKKNQIIDKATVVLLEAFPPEG